MRRRRTHAHEGPRLAPLACILSPEWKERRSTWWPLCKPDIVHCRWGAQLTGGRSDAIIMITRMTKEALWHKYLFESWTKRLWSA